MSPDNASSIKRKRRRNEETDLSNYKRRLRCCNKKRTWFWCFSYLQLDLNPSAGKQLDKICRTCVAWHLCSYFFGDYDGANTYNCGSL